MPQMSPQRARIDTKEGIQAMLHVGGSDSLVGLTMLIDERARWIKEHPTEFLNEWYVFAGRVHLDKRGGHSTVVFSPDIDWIHPGELRPELSISWTSGAVPREIDRCLHCDDSITPRQLATAFVGSYNTETGRIETYHQECRILMLDEIRRRDFLTAFANAGLTQPDLHSMPSGYTDTRWTGPWYRVESKELGRLRLGWRKSVIQLSWKDSKVLEHLNGNKVFQQEKVTTDYTMVHAWGYAKLALYLMTLASQARTASEGEP